VDAASFITGGVLFEPLSDSDIDVRGVGFLEQRRGVPFLSHVRLLVCLSLLSVCRYNRSVVWRRACLAPACLSCTVYYRPYIYFSN